MPSSPESPAPDSSQKTPSGVLPPGTNAIHRRWRSEIWIVLGLSLGQSAVYSILAIVRRLTDEQPLGLQSTSVNASQSDTEYLDLLLQLCQIGFALVPVALVFYLLSPSGRSAAQQLGFDGTRPGRDALAGFGFAAAIGIPGLGFYYLGRVVGITVQVNAADLGSYWWTVPVLILAALKNAVVEEVIVVGYLMTRLRQLRWSAPVAIIASALLRGTYHLYQGIGPFLGNIIMGIVFAEYFRRTRRVLPLVIAHTVIDIIAFVGYALLPPSWREALWLT